MLILNRNTFIAFSDSISRNNLLQFLIKKKEKNVSASTLISLFMHVSYMNIFYDTLFFNSCCYLEFKMLQARKISKYVYVPLNKIHSCATI